MIFRIPKMNSLDNLEFCNNSLSDLPLDPIKDRASRSVKGAWFSLLEPQLEPLENPLLVSWSPEALDLLGLSTDQVGDFALLTQSHFILWLSTRILIELSACF